MGRRIFCITLFAFVLRGSAAAAGDPWVKVTSAHFTLLTDAGEKEGRRVVDQFERMRWVFHALFRMANVDPAEPIVVLAAKNQKTFSTLEPAAYLAKGQMKLGGYFLHSTDRNYILLNLDEQYEHAFASVYHEYTHVQFSDELLPLWLNEGIAEFMQNTDINGKDVQLGQPSVDDILYLRQNRIIPLPVLFKVDSNSPYYHEEQKGSVFYAESWALTHYLLMTDHQNHAHRVDDYIALTKQNVDPLTAAEKAFGDLKQLEAALHSYIEAGQYKEFVMSSAGAPIDESSYKIEALMQGQSDAARADVLASMGRTDDAHTLLDAILKDDPNNAQAHETKGFLAFRAGNIEEARKEYGEAVKLGSQDFLACYYFAVFSMYGGSQDASPEIETNLRNAIRINPRFAPAYDRLATYFGMKRENLDDAHAISLMAIELDPTNIGFRVNSANILIEEDRYSDATTVLNATAKLAKKPEDISLVQNRIDEINRMQAMRTEITADTSAQPSTQVSSTPVVVDIAPKYPTMPVTGPKLAVIGVIRGVACSYPSEIEFRVESAAGKSVSLYDNNFGNIDLTEVGLTFSGSVNPCSDFEGKKARVQYVASSDKSVNGQVVAIELRK
jgi:tetratricopeptide (TPR) repeat protein